MYYYVENGEKMLEFKIKCFNLKYTLECGQCFRWKKVEDYDNRYIGVIQDRVIDVEQKGNIVRVSSNKEENLEDVVKKYFDLNTDYEEIENRIVKIDDNIYISVQNTSGLRILNQSLFETIISYIISANNNIKRISKSVDKISEMFGKKVEYDDKTYYLFPTLEELSKATVEDLISCGVGFRAKYIKSTVKELMENNHLLNTLKEMTTEKAKEILLGFAGVGPKVSDCILLFSLKKSEVFPIDVWVKRVMEKLYFKGNVSIKQISEYAKLNFGKDAGIIQQHLFYNVREGEI